MPGLPTGVEGLDAALPSGGVPRGRLTEILGARGSGKTTFVRRIVEETVGRGGWVAYIDAARTLAPRDWAHLGEREGVWMIRPTDPGRGAWCADVLLRSGAFALLVLDGAPALTRSVAVRLTRLAREGDAALIVIGDERGGTATLLGGALRLRLAGGRECGVPGRRHRAERWRRRHEGGAGDEGGEVFPAQGAVRQLVIAVEKGGVSQKVEVSCAIRVARRLCSHPEVPDRRGVARRAAGGAVTRGRERGGGGGGGGEGEGARTRPASAAGAELAAPERRELARKRRCAEPEFGRGREAPRALRAAVARARSLG